MSSQNKSLSILVTGATGFTGQHVIQELKKHTDIEIHAFVRSIEKAKAQGLDSIAILHEGSFEDPSSFQNALEGIDILLNIASLGFGHAEDILNCCASATLKKAVFVSTTGIFTKLNPSSKTVRVAAENAIQRSDTPYVIIRPTMIFGTSEDRNIARFLKFLQRSPIIPVLGPGTFLQQPVYVRDLATAIVNAGLKTDCINTELNISGKAPLTYNQLIDTAKTLLNTTCFKLHIPYKLAILAAKLQEVLLPRPLVKAEQIQRLNENKDFSHEDASKQIDYSPVDIETALKNEIEDMKSKGLLK